MGTQFFLGEADHAFKREKDIRRRQSYYLQEGGRAAEGDLPGRGEKGVQKLKKINRGRRSDS